MPTIHGLNVDEALYNTVEQIAGGTGYGAAVIFEKFAGVLSRKSKGTDKSLLEHNRDLLDRRDDLQEQLNTYHREHPGRPSNVDNYKEYLSRIGYIVPEGAAFHVTTRNVDPELAEISAPQLVVPLDNARFALNAMNARWGSLYDALYGTNIVPDEGEIARGAGYNAKRGEEVIKQANEFLDGVVRARIGPFCRRNPVLS